MKRKTGLACIIVDDHQLVAKLLSSHMSDMKIFTTIEIANTGKELMLLLGSAKFDLVLLDILLPDANGLDLAKTILEQYPEIKIVFLTALSEYKVVQDGLALGAHGFINKAAQIQEIREAITTILDGEKYICKKSLNAFVDISSKSMEYTKFIKESDLLSEREMQVLLLLLDEFDVSEISEKLFISHRAVETHKKKIMEKLGAKSIVGLIKIIYEKNLLKFD